MALLAFQWHGRMLVSTLQPVRVGVKAFEEGLRFGCLQDLPTDAFSMQNAAIICNARRYALLIDPQAQAKAWLVKRTPPPGLRVSRFSDSTFSSALEACLSTGGCGCRCLRVPARWEPSRA
jgi:hypothetical protein